MLLWVIKGRLFEEHISCRCVFLGRILETATLLASVFTDLASQIISFAISFGSFLLDKLFVPT